MSSTQFSEKSGAEWFYAIRGDAARHGLVDEATLFRMATEGRLHPDDLLWNKGQSGRWQRASSLTGLFPEPEDRVDPVPPLAEKTAPVSRRHRTSLPVLLVIGVVLISTASWLSQKLYIHEIKPSPRLVRLFGIETPENSVASLGTQTRLIDLYLQREDAVRAEALIDELLRSESHREHAAVYRRRLADLQADLARRQVLRDSYDTAVRYLDDGRLAEADTLIARLRDADAFKEQAAALARRSQAMKGERQRKQAFRRRLRAGDIHSDNAQVLIDVYRQNNEEHELSAEIEDAIRHRAQLPPRMCLSTAYVYLALKQPTHASVAMAYFLEKADRTGPEADFLSAAQVYNALGNPEKAMAVLTDYLAANPDMVAARFELAALQALADERQAALKHLRLAVKQGGDAVRHKAVADTRFDAVRETWTFRRLVRIRE